MKNTYTKIECEGFRDYLDELPPEAQNDPNLPMDDFVVYTCNDCGAHAMHDPKNVKHHATCNPGDFEKWLKYYDSPEWAEACEPEEDEDLTTALNFIDRLFDDLD